MHRNALDELVEWKNDNYRRKPLILKGARQVGKTWLAKEFGRLHYEDTFYFNFEREEKLRTIFQVDKDPVRLIEMLGSMRGKMILPGKHLIIFDEIQECPEAMVSLKYFCEEASEYHIISAGSLLGTHLAQPMSYPVGNASIMNIYPLTFDEFLAATNSILYSAYFLMNGTDLTDEVFHNSMLEAYAFYLIVGGMPESVLAWMETKDPARVKRVQSKLVALYEHDISKHHGKINSGKIMLVFRSITAQLAKENEKFIYGCISESARAREFEDAIEWLVSAGILVRICNVSRPEHPLNAFQRLGCFKLFMCDVGLLKYMAGVKNEAILLNSSYLFKGPLTENYILQQIRDLFDVEPKYFTFTGSTRGEIDFLLQDGMDIIPVEVKAGESVKANSFKNYINKYAPAKAIRYSKLKYCQNSAVTNIPLYLAGKTRELI